MIWWLYIQLLQWCNESVFSIQISPGRSVQDCTGYPYDRVNTFRRLISQFLEARENIYSLILWNSVTIHVPPGLTLKNSTFWTQNMFTYLNTSHNKKRLFLCTRLIDFYVFCMVHCNIIRQYKPIKFNFPKLIF